MKTIKYPKKYDFTPGTSNNTVYLAGLDDCDIDNIKKAYPKADALLINNEVDLDEKWDYTHCGESEVAVISFYEGCNVDRLLLLGHKYYTKFPPTTFILLDKKCKRYKLIADYIEKCGLKVSTIEEAVKFCLTLNADKVQ